MKIRTKDSNGVEADYVVSEVNDPQGAKTLKHIDKDLGLEVIEIGRAHV